jgi:hypothetical protein
VSTMNRRVVALGLLAAVSVVACGQGVLGDGEGTDAALEVATDTATVTPSDTGVVVDTSVTDAPADAAEILADVTDAGPHVCPAASAPRDCSVGTGTGTGDQCKDAPSCYLTIVQKVVNDLVSTHPDWFDFTGPSGCPVIKNVDTFLDAVVATILAKGYCVERDPNAPNQEITMKKDNAFSENFALVSSAGCARSGAPIYTGYCAPAWW